MKKKPHEIIISKLKGDLSKLGYEVVETREEYDEDKHAKTPETEAFFHYLLVKIRGYEKVRIRAHYECLDVDEDEYSCDTLDEISIGVLEVTSSEEKTDSLERAENRAGVFSKKHKAIIDAVKSFGLKVTLNFSSDVVNSRGQHSAGSTRCEI